MEVRIKIGDAVNVIQRDLRRFRKRFQLVSGKIAVLILDGPEFVEDQMQFLRPLRREIHVVRFIIE